MDDASLLHWEDLPVGWSREMGGITVTREEILAFARQFDPQPFHLDEEAARRTHFGGLVASGWHTAGLAMRMWCEGVLLGAASEGSPGVSELKWVAPVRPGDTLRLRVEVTEARPMASRPRLGLVNARWNVLNQDGQTVMRMTAWMMMRRRHPG